MRGRVGSTRTLQIGIVGLLVTCIAQVSWWILDQVWMTRSVRERILSEWEADVMAADRLLVTGASQAEVARLFPHVAFDELGRAHVDPASSERLERERKSRLNRYGWEGAFFLLVLLAGMAVILQALRQRAELARRQQNFLAAVSHEFKSPLASLKLAAETLLFRKPQGDAADRVTQRMVLDVDRLGTMVTNLLEAAQIDEGHVPLARETVPLAGALAPRLEEARCRAHLRGVEVVSEVPRELCVQGDPAAVSTVLANLVGNAVKSTAAKGGGTVRVGACVEGRHVRVDVQDDGVGFDPREGPRLFEKFYRPGDELRRRTEGSGLGLYIVRRFVQAGGGRVEAASDGPGRGARFSVWWPSANGEERAS